MGIVVLLSLLACRSPEPVSEPEPAPVERTEPWNVVVVLSDALRASNLHTYGYPRSTTPHLDALTEESLLFEHAFAHFPGTPVSVSQLHTGRYRPPLLMGARLFAIPVRGVPEDLPLLPRVLDEAGYQTALVSSHYWWTDDSRLLEHFDTVSVVLDDDAPYVPFEGLIGPTEAFLDSVGKQPFFLYVHSMDTHGPWRDLDADLDDPAFPEAYSRLDTDIRRTDRGVGEIVDALKERDLWDRTVFVFTSDHGDEFGELGPEPWNRNHGLQVRRPLAEVPLIVRLPEGARGKRPEVVGLVDLAPTLTALAKPGLTFGASDGRDLSAQWLSGAQGDAERHVFGWSGRFRAVYEADRELIRDPWSASDTTSRIERDERNYPRGIPTEPDPELARALDAAWTSWVAFDASLPLATTLAEGAQVHVPFELVKGSVGFEDVADDGKWSHAGPVLKAWPGEAGPIAFTQPWAPGTYRVELALEIPDDSWNTQLKVKFDDGPWVAPTRSEDGRIAVIEGVELKGRSYEVAFDPGKTGAAIRALTFYGGGGTTGDPDLPEKLEKLGYR